MLVTVAATDTYANVSAPNVFSTRNLSTLMINGSKMPVATNGILLRKIPTIVAALTILNVACALDGPKWTDNRYKYTMHNPTLKTKYCDTK